jgi:DNA primase
MIAAGFIQDLRDRADIVEVIDRRVPLTKRGKDYWALCPFDGETGKPAFSVNREKRFYHCFGCGAHGDALEFLQRHGGMTFLQAVEQLAGETGMRMPDGKAPANKPALKVTAKFRPTAAAKVGHIALDDEQLARLVRWQSILPGSPGEAYLASRGIPLAVAQAAGVGFLPAGEALGLNAEGKPTGYGPRVVFPHALPGGEIVNVYGRSTVRNAEKDRRHRHMDRPKGIFNAAALDLPGPLWVVEGTFDALALIAAGAVKVIAIFGLNGFDWRWIGRNELIVALDHDDDGKDDEAAKALMREAAYRGLKVRRLPAEAFGGRKDASDAWQAGVLNLGSAGITVAVNRDTVADEVRKKIDVLPDPADPDHARHWPQYRALAARFVVQHLDHALAAGWTLEQLFSLPTTRLGTDAGVLWTAAAFDPEALRVYPDRLEIETGSQNALVEHKADLRPSGILPWLV